MNQQQFQSISIDTDQGIKLCEHLMQICIKAGDAISRHYQQHLSEVSYKNGDLESPLTQADLDSNQMIEEELAIYGIPILSEENHQRNVYPSQDDYFWLIDPLDGTRDFIKRNPEFTISIALIYRFRPVIGVVYAPELKDGCVGNLLAKQAFSFYVDDKYQISTQVNQTQTYQEHQKAKILMSRIEYQKGLKPVFFSYAQQFPEYEVIPCGSAYKFCKIARGEAHFYPRFENIMLWDIAGGEAVVEAAGGCMRTIDQEVILYNRFDTFEAPLIRVKA